MTIKFSNSDNYQGKESLTSRSIFCYRIWTPCQICIAVLKKVKQLSN